MTLEKVEGPDRRPPVAWIGDGNNVAASWMQAAVQFDFELGVATPPSLNPRGQ